MRFSEPEVDQPLFGQVHVLKIAVFWGAIALLATPSSVLPAQQAELFDRFSLWTGCETMRLVVQELGPDAADIDLSAGSLQAAAEARLRAARLYTDKTLRFDADDSLVPITSSTHAQNLPICKTSALNRNMERFRGIRLEFLKPDFTAAPSPMLSVAALIFRVLK